MSCTNCIWYDALADCGKVKWDEKGHCVNFESSKTILVSECWKCKKHDGKNGCGVADFNAEGYCNNFDFDEVKEEKVECDNLKKEELRKHVNPEHYKQQCSLECIDIMVMMFGAKHIAEYCVTNAFKYVWRQKFKNKLEDLKKAEWYLNKFDELVVYCKTMFSADGTIESRYVEIATKLRMLMKKGIEEYEK